MIGNDVIATPIEYYPLSANYAATWMGDKGFTELNASLNFSLRGVGSRRGGLREQTLQRRRQLHLSAQRPRPHPRPPRRLAGVRKNPGPALQPAARQQRAVRRRRPRHRPRLSRSHRARRQRRLRHRRAARPVAARLYREIPRHRREGGRVALLCLLRCRHGQALRRASRPGLDTSASPASASAAAANVYKHYNASVDIAVPLIEEADTDRGEVRVTFRGWADF